MKRLATLFLFLLQPLLAEEKPLSDIDRELLLEKLKVIQSGSDSTVKGRYGVALAAFREGRESPAAAHSLYLKCVDKVRFEDQGKKASEFREWKNRHKETKDSAGFRTALRHQLNWLVISIEATEKEDLTSISSQCISVIEAILRDAKDLKEQQALLKSPVLQSAFAKAYNIDNIKVAQLPQSPLAISEAYENIILPPLRSAKTNEALRQGWLKRIEHEGLLLEEWTNEASTGKDRKPAFDKWLIEGRQDLMWKMERDLFTHGDQRGASLRMLTHLEKNLSHKSAPRWIQQFTRLINGEPAEEEDEETTRKTKKKSK